MLTCLVKSSRRLQINNLLKLFRIRVLGKFRKEFRRAFNCCSSSNTSSLGELNSMYYKNIGRDSGLGSTTPSRTSRSSKRHHVEIRHNDTMVDELRN